jgi:L-arginine dehydrogenase
MLVLTADQVGTLLSRIDAVATMRRLFASLAEGAVVQPPQVVTELVGAGEGADFITYLAALAEPPVFGGKLSPYLPGNGRAKVTAWTLLMSSVDGAPLLLCDSLALTTERTAATTALAVDLLAPREPGVLAVIGSGPVGIAHLRHSAGLRAWSEVRCWSPAAGKRRAAIQEAAPRAVIGESLESTVRDAQVVLLCTSSAAPVLDPRSLEQCALVTSLSTNAPGAHEVPPESLPDLDCYCDFRETTPNAAAEMLLAQRFGWSPEHLVGDLPALASGRAELPSRTAFFRSLGLGCEDIAIAAALFQEAGGQG